MNIKSVISAITILVLSTSTNAAVINVFFAGGQSNATWRWAEGIDNVLSNHYDNVLLVHQNQPGARLDTWFDQEPQTNYELDFFNSSGTGLLQQTINNAVIQGDTVNFRGLFWFQGESDTGTIHADDYAERFSSMLSQLAVDLEDSEFYFDMAIIDYDPDYAEEGPGGRTAEDVENMRLIQQEIIDSSSNGLGFDTRGYGRRDFWHLTHEYQTIVGEAMANNHLILATPTPAAVWLFGSGLIGLVGFAKRKKT